MRRAWASLWGVGGVLAMLADAIVRLTPLALAPWLDDTISAGVALAYLASVAFFGVFEGYRGFQKAFSPRAAARALWLDEHGRLWLKLAAPLFCMGLVVATRRRLIANWLLVAGIVAIVLGMRIVPQPWRAVVDGGVVVGLTWGAISLVISYVRGLFGKPPAVPLELP